MDLDMFGIVTIITALIVIIILAYDIRRRSKGLEDRIEHIKMVHNNAINNYEKAIEDERKRLLYEADNVMPNEKARFARFYLVDKESGKYLTFDNNDGVLRLRLMEYNNDIPTSFLWKITNESMIRSVSHGLYLCIDDRGLLRLWIRGTYDEEKYQFTLSGDGKIMSISNGNYFGVGGTYIALTNEDRAHAFDMRI